ncbi:MAG: argininosuccinate lyase [Candidatus Marinimicrobia bacterium]|nr:argininosuccinate lyase [Candidatus Neomarinimicrobiota bacterium]
MKLWQKTRLLDREIEKFTVGRDYILDKELVYFDCIASKAHARMLGKIGILTDKEVKELLHGLDKIIELDKKGKFKIALEDEDCHTAIENYLIEHVGNAGKKIHTGRSRNDQVLTAVRLYCKAKLGHCLDAIEVTISHIDDFIKTFGKIPMPGYTHTRKAMPSSVGLWAGAFKDAFTDDLDLLKAAVKLVDQNPLGTGAGYGIPLPLDRQMTTDELGFAKIQENPIYAQNSRGKFESFILTVLGQVMLDINKLATDLVLFTLPSMAYFILPEEFLTGSSIMPQKKNPDVLELLRGKYHEIFAYEIQVRNTSVNLISGYHRDIQLTKEAVIRGFSTVLESIHVTGLIFQNLKVIEENCEVAMTDELYAAEKAYHLVQQGIPFRDAYREIGKRYESSKVLYYE